MVPRERARGNEHRLKYRKFHLNLRKYFFYYDRLHRETQVSSLKEIFKAWLDVAPRSLL